MAQKVTLTDSTSGEIVYPQTLVSSVQNEEGTALESLVLMKDNTTTFSPTGDYNPSTKKYVDDTIAERLANEELSLPMGPVISIKDVATVVYHINNFK